MHWTLDDLLALPIDVYEELITWINETHQTPEL